MNATIVLYRPNGQAATIPIVIGAGSVREFMLMQYDRVTLKFTSEVCMDLHLGDYVNIEGVGRYEVTEPYTPTQNASTLAYEYELPLEAQYWKFKNKLLKFLPQVGTGETSWSLTDTLPNHAAQIVDNMNALAYARDDSGNDTLISGRGSYLYNGATRWEAQWDATIDTTKAVAVAYESTNIIDAITAIAEAYECEWWFEQNVLHFGKCQFGEPLTLTYGTEITNIDPRDSQDDYATRIYAYGSDRNLPSTYRKELVFVADKVRGNFIGDSTRPLEATWFTANGATPVACIDNQAACTFSQPEDDTATDATATAYAQLGEDYTKTTVIASRQMTVTPPASADGEDFYTGTKYALGISALTGTFKQTAGNADGSIHLLVKAIAHLDPDQYTDPIQVVTAEVSKPITANGEIITLVVPDQQITFLGIPLSVEIASEMFVTSSDEVGQGRTFTASRLGTAAICKNAAWRADNVTIEVIDKATGEVSRTITGAVFNPYFDDDPYAIRLPSGKTMQLLDKYRLPGLNTAIVPAAYFTSKYSVFEKYADIVTNGIVNSRLLLPEQDTDGTAICGYVQASGISAEEEAVEDVVIFEDIYPSRTSTIAEVVPIVGEYADEQTEQDGSTTITQWTAYKIKDDLFNADNPFKSEYLLDDTDLQITFQGGALNGMTFGVAYTDDHYFEIQRDDDTKLPNEFLKPTAGDTYILHGFNIAMISDADADYIASAERRLLAKAREYVASLAEDASTYECTIACDYAKQAEDASPNSLYLSIGRAVKIIHPGYFPQGRVSRVIGYEVPLDYPYDNPKYIVGESAAYTRLGAIEDKLDALETTAGILGAAIGGTSKASGAATYLIATGDATAPTDRNAYSALRSRAEFALKKSAEKIQALWSFLRGIRVGDYVAGYKGAAIDAGGNAELESATIRSHLKVYELIYNRINAQEGNTSFADVGTIESVKDRDGGVQALTMRKRWDGDITAFQPYDIIYGYANDLGDGKGKSSYKAWAVVSEVYPGDNVIVVAPYPDAMTPAGVNHPMAPNMVIARWGNAVAANADTYAMQSLRGNVITYDGDKYRNIRQSTFYISCEDGNIVELTGVNQPILTSSNYGTVLGKIPGGLLDAATEELVNKDQPYLYARGIIVQDLVRIDYQGQPLREANYRGQWSAATASGSSPYRSAATSYDTATWKDCLWQCIIDGTTEEPGASPGWVRMSGVAGLAVWQIMADASAISRRYNADGSITATPATIHYSAIKTDTDGTTAYPDTNTAALDEAGMAVWRAVDGGAWAKVTWNGGINTNVITQSLALELRDADGNAVAALTIPAVTDGQDGEQGPQGEQGIQGIQGEQGEQGPAGDAGRDGLLAYPAGEYSADAAYTAEADSTPVVLCGGNYYALKPGATYQGAAMTALRNTPALDVANGGSDARWRLLERFNTIFADILMANFAKISSAVIYGDWMISQYGTLYTLTEHRYGAFQTAIGPMAGNILAPGQNAQREPAGFSTTYPDTVPDGYSVYMIAAAINRDDTLRGLWSRPVAVTDIVEDVVSSEEDSTQYQLFKASASGLETFTPNFAVNFLTGEVRAKTITFERFIKPTTTVIDESNFRLYLTQATIEGYTRTILDAPKFTDVVIFDPSLDEYMGQAVSSRPHGWGEFSPYFRLPSSPLPEGATYDLNDYYGKTMRFVNNTTQDILFAGNMRNATTTDIDVWESYPYIEPGYEIVAKCVFKEWLGYKQVGWEIEYHGPSTIIGTSAT